VSRKGYGVVDSSSLRGQVEKHPHYKKRSPRAVKLFEKHKSYPSETALASTKDCHGAGWDRRGEEFPGEEGLPLNHRRQPLLVGFAGNVRRNHRLSDESASPISRRKNKCLCLRPPFHTRRFRGIHIRRFIELNNLLARLSYESSASEPASAVVAQPNSDVTEQIAKLATLREQGHITSEEYERKKAELLDRL
jgi:Short C-terminal domain